MATRPAAGSTTTLVTIMTVGPFSSQASSALPTSLLRSPGPDLGDAVGLGDVRRRVVPDDHAQQSLVERELLAELFGVDAV